MPYAKFTDSVNGDYAIPIKTESENVYVKLGATIATQDTDLADATLDMLSASTAKKDGRGFNVAVTVKTGTGSAARWKRRILYCPVGKATEVVKLLIGVTAYGGVVKRCYFPRRGDFK